jgi:Protein of unknown function (DUF3040)
MALSMDEQRMLDEMERKLADDDPLLASRLTSFGHPGLAVMMRSPRARLVVGLAVLAAIAMIAVVVYTIGSFRQADRPAPARSAAPHGVTQQRPHLSNGASTAAGQLAR